MVQVNVIGDEYETAKSVPHVPLQRFTSYNTVVTTVQKQAYNILEIKEYT